ncbi:hypothetical protein BDW60DRAFT_199923, partial [Aspergillus nidulans var. acristatus]
SGSSDNNIEGHPIPYLQRYYNQTGERLICLPPEYHQFSSSAVKGATIALGYPDGQSLVIGFHAPWAEPLYSIQ